MLEAVPWENPMYGISGGAAGNVAYGGTVNPPRNRKGGAGNPPPTGARASALPNAKYYGKRIAAPYGRMKSDLASQTAVHSAAASVRRPQGESSAAQKDYPTQLAQSRMCGLSTPKILYKSMQSCAPFQTSRRLP